jgi:hypothetical protein
MPLPTGNKFAKHGFAGAKPAAKPKPKKFGAATDATPRDPMLPEGEFRVRHLYGEELLHPVKKTLSWRVQFNAVQNGEESGPFIALFMNTTAGIAEFQRYCVAMAGYENAQEFNAFAQAVMPDDDVDGACDAFFTSVIGDANAFSAAGHRIEGRLVDVRVAYGKACLGQDGQPTGDHYRNYKWAPVPDDEQDTVGKLEASA